jgi:CheY-like chemotaxis protein
MEDRMASVLVLEDDIVFRDALKKTLQKAGYSVEVAANGRQGWEFFKETPPDVVITDLQMPSQSGVRTIDQIRKLAPDVPIIAMSGAAQNLLDAAIHKGANVRLAKPFEMNDLLAAVAMLLEADEAAPDSTT